MTFLVVIFAAIFAVAFASNCCFPGQFEGAMVFEKNGGGRQNTLIKSMKGNRIFNKAFNGICSLKSLRFPSRHGMFGRWFKIIGEVNEFISTFQRSENGRLKGTTSFSIDKENLKMATQTRFVQRNEEKNVKVVSDFNGGYIYFISEEKQKCFKKQTEMKPTWCISDDFSLAEQYYFGANDDSLKLNDYRMVKNKRQLDISVTEQQCIPVLTYITDETNSRNRGERDHHRVTYNNITVGIQDESVFNLPSICDNAVTITEETSNCIEFHELLLADFLA